MQEIQLYIFITEFILKFLLKSPGRKGEGNSGIFPEMAFSYQIVYTACNKALGHDELSVLGVVVVELSLVPYS